MPNYWRVILGIAVVKHDQADYRAKIIPILDLSDVIEACLADEFREAIVVCCKLKATQVS